MSNEKRRNIIVGLGNPGEQYAETRHNLGSMAVSFFAQAHGLSFKRDKMLKGSVANGDVRECSVSLLLPSTYMNLSGTSVQKAQQFFKCLPADFLVVSDDIMLPFGSLRLRLQGGAGGHNGLKNIQTHLGTQEYPRLKIGIGSPVVEPVESYVLSEFTNQEKLKLPDIFIQAKMCIEEWLLKEIKE